MQRGAGAVRHGGGIPATPRRRGRGRWAGGEGALRTNLITTFSYVMGLAFSGARPTNPNPNPFDSPSQYFSPPHTIGIPNATVTPTVTVSSSEYLAPAAIASEDRRSDSYS
ncbi:hypothetical protein R6Q59_034091 [Mikania micrantha]